MASSRKYTFISVLLLLLYSIYARSSPLNTLKGKGIVAGVIHEPPWAIIKTSGDVEGLGPSIMRKVAELLQFTVKFQPYNGSFDGFIDKLAACSNGSLSKASCKNFPTFGGGGWTPNSDRISKVHFSLSLSAAGTFSAVTNADLYATTADRWILLRPFSIGLWLLIVLFVVLNFMFSFLNYVWTRETSAEDGSASQDFSNSVLLLLGRSGESSSRVLPRIRDIILAVTGLMTFLIYEATLTGMRTTDIKPRAPFRSIENVRECKVDVSKIVLVKRGAADAYFRQRVLSSSCNKGKKVKTCSSIESCLEMVVAGDAEYAVLGSGISKYFLSRRFCTKLVETGDPFFASDGVSFVLPLGSPHALIMDWAILRLQEQEKVPTVDDFLGKCEPRAQGPETVASELFFTILCPGMTILCILILTRFVQIFSRRIRNLRAKAVIQSVSVINAREEQLQNMPTLRLSHEVEVNR